MSMVLLLGGITAGSVYGMAKARDAGLRSGCFAVVIFIALIVATAGLQALA